jgi:hypothetical protein
VNAVATGPAWMHFFVRQLTGGPPYDMLARMPVIARFYGIAIRMYSREHGVPHFHAIYGDSNAVFAIETLELLEGRLPNRAHRLVRDWATEHQADLHEMWRTQIFRQLSGLE